MLYGLRVLEIRETAELYPDAFVLIGGKHADDMKRNLEKKDIKNIRKIVFNTDGERWGTEYGGFYIPRHFAKKTPF